MAPRFFRLLLVAGVLAAPVSPARAQSPGSEPAAPVPLGVDGALTSWLLVRGELRTRVEGFTSGGYTDGNDDAYWMDRWRFSATVHPRASMQFFVQAQDSRAFQKTAGGMALPLRNTMDLHQGYAQFGTTTMVRAGRQEVTFGEQRLIGSSTWLNAPRAFDGARVTHKTSIGQFDAVALSVVVNDPEEFDKSGHGNALYGTYESLTGVVPRQTIEPYFFWRSSTNVAVEHGGTAALHQSTIGVRMAGALPSAFDYSGDIALQRGSVGSDTVKAWAGHGVVGRTFSSPVKPRVFGEFNHASGDANPVDGTRGTFDQLYPSGHDKYGLADQVGWRNINHARVAVDIKPTPKWLVSGGYHNFWLASATDGLYNSGGTLVARSAAGTAGTYVGWEVDVQAAFIYSPHLQVYAGYARFVPGEFLQNTTGGHTYNYPFVTATYVFAGESLTKPTK